MANCISSDNEEMPNPDDELILDQCDQDCWPREENKSEQTTPTRPNSAKRTKPRRRSAAKNVPELVPSVGPLSTEKGRKRKMLTKKDILRIKEAITNMPLELMENTVETVLKEQFTEKPELLQALLTNKTLLKLLIVHHHTTFVILYDQFKTGKDKYLFFQVEWYNSCSIFLAPRHDNEVCEAKIAWDNFCVSFTSQVADCNKLIVQMSSILLKMFLAEVHSVKTTSFTVSHPSTTNNPDEDDVYFRFGGAVLSSMLRTRYKNIRTCHESKRDQISQEITILQGINTKEKSCMPDYLHYRDHGHMYSPHATFIPFVREVDNCVRDVVNNQKLDEHKDEIVKVAHENLKKQVYLKKMFVDHLSQLVPVENDFEQMPIDAVYEDMTKKLCNIQVEEFLSSLKQKLASDKGFASTSGQNLRDGLLTQHTQLHSHSKNK